MSIFNGKHHCLPLGLDEAKHNGEAVKESYLLFFHQLLFGAFLIINNVFFWCLTSASKKSKHGEFEPCATSLWLFRHRLNSLLVTFLHILEGSCHYLNKVCDFQVTSFLTLTRDSSAKTPAVSILSGSGSASKERSSAGFSCGRNYNKKG